MGKIQIRKGNLYNGLTKKIDASIVDGNQYDLELKIDNNINYYRVRFFDSKFEAEPIFLNKEQFLLPTFSGICSMDEISSFRNTHFYRHDFEYYHEFEIERRKTKQAISSLDYFIYLQRRLSKNQLSAERIYDFFLPAICGREKLGVLGYDVSIECVKKYYYVVFFQELVERGFTQSNQDLYLIYQRPQFLQQKKQLEERVLDICLEKDSPITLTELIYLCTNGDKTAIDELNSKIQQARSNKNIDILLNSNRYSILQFNMEKNNDLAQELLKYVNQQQDDINYQYQKKRW